MNESDFTQRQQDVIRLLKEGKSNQQIALELGIKERTVEDHLTHIYETLGVTSRTEAIVQLGKTTPGTADRPAVESTIADRAQPVYAENKEHAHTKQTNRIWLIACLILGIAVIGAFLIYRSNAKPWYYEREAEFPDRFTVGQAVARSDASGNKAHGQFGSLSVAPWSPQSGELEYYNIEMPKSAEVFLRLRYSKFSVQSVRILIFVDAEETPRAFILPFDQGDWNKFIWTDWIPLGKIDKGKHSIRFQTNGQEYGVADLDKFILTTEPPE
jgi:DNA-binding CsgD family transcriptional regulator